LYEKTYSYGQSKAIAYVKIQGNDPPKGKYKEGEYWVGTVSIPVKFTGDKYYMYENTKNWNNLWDNVAKCNENGCSNAKRVLSTQEEVVLATTGNEYHGCPIFVSWDYNRNDASNGDWSWVWKSGGWGWQGELNDCLNIKSVKCYDDSDCGAGLVCDKLGTWKEWSCKIEPEGAVYRYNPDNNQCTFIVVKQADVTENDFETKEECEMKIVEPPLKYNIVFIIFGIFLAGALIYYLNRNKLKRRKR